MDQFAQIWSDRLVKFARQFRVFLSHLTEFPAGSRQWMASAALWPLRRQMATRCHKPNSLHIDSMWPPSRAVSLPNNIKQPLEHTSNISVKNKTAEHPFVQVLPNIDEQASVRKLCAMQQDSGFLVLVGLRTAPLWRDLPEAWNWY